MTADAPVTELPLAGLKLLRPRLFQDERGYFVETHNQKRYAAFGIADLFVQDNVSLSRNGVLRGLHYQHPHGQAKLVHVLRGEIFDVVVDLRKDSPTFRRWHGVHLSSADHAQLYVPRGFAHGFCVLSDEALVQYKCTDFYDPSSEHTLLATDPALGITWPVAEPQLSAKDTAGRRLADAVLPD